MLRQSALGLVLVLILVLVGGAAVSALVGGAAAAALDRTVHPAPAAAGQDKPGGWTLPPDADRKKSPVPVDARVLAQGKSVFKNKCQRCHGASGLGDGADADPDHQADMDLTVAGRAAKNPDGVVFYKVSNGRKKPKMPAFKDELTEAQIWSVVAYAQSLRAK